MTQSNARLTATNCWPAPAIAAVSAFCTQAVPHPALLIGSFAQVTGLPAIWQHRCGPADLLAEAQSTPWPANTFLRIAAAPDSHDTDLLDLQLAEWLRICRPQGKLLLLASNPYYWQRFRLPENLPALPPEYLLEAAAAIGWQPLQTDYFTRRDKSSSILFKNLFGRCTAPIYGLYLQKRVYAAPPADGAAVAENVELSALGIACGQAKPL